MKTMILMLLPVLAWGQFTPPGGGGGAATSVKLQGPTLPSSCTPGKLFQRTGATNPGLYNCTSTDVWTLVATGTSVTVTAGAGIVVVDNQISIDQTWVPTFQSDTADPTGACTLGSIAHRTDTDEMWMCPNATWIKIAKNSSLSSYQATSAKDQANGYAGLDSGGKISASAVPAPGASTLGGLNSKTCTAGQYVNEISTAGAVTCGTPTGGSSGPPLPHTKRWAYMVYPGSGTALTGVGDTATTTGTGSAGSGLPSTTEYSMLNAVSGASNPSPAGASGVGHWATNWSPRNQIYARFPASGDYATVNAFIGLTDGANIAAVTTNPLGSAYSIGFVFSTAAGDTNWMCTIQSGSNITKLSSGVAAGSTTGRKFEVWHDYANTTAHFYIDGTEVCGAISQANLPGSGRYYRYIAGLSTLEAVAKNIQIAYVYTEAGK